MSVQLAPVLVAAPTAAPVSLAEAKTHCRVDHDEDDVMIGAMIAAAVSHLDGWTGTLGRCLMRQTWRIDLPGLPANGIMALPLHPVASVSIDVVDPTGAVSPLGDDEFVLRQTVGGPVVRHPAGVAWPATADVDDAVRITCLCGAEDAAGVPSSIRSAILLMVGDLYRNRETTGTGSGVIGEIPMSLTVDRLLAPWRRTFP